MYCGFVARGGVAVMRRVSATGSRDLHYTEIILSLLCLGEAFATKQYHACAECSHNDKAAGVTIERASEEEYGARHDEAAQ